MRKTRKKKARVCAFSIQRTRPSRSLEQAINLPSLPFRMVLCTSSSVTHVSRLHLFETTRKPKRLRRRLDRGDTRLYMPLNMKSMGFLLQFFESFRGKINKKYSTGNEEWIKSETATITSDYVVSWAFHKLTCRQYKCTPKKRTILLFFFNSKRYRDFC